MSAKSVFSNFFLKLFDILNFRERERTVLCRYVDQIVPLLEANFELVLLSHRRYTAICTLTTRGQFGEFREIIRLVVSCVYRSLLGILTSCQIGADNIPPSFRLRTNSF